MSEAGRVGKTHLWRWAGLIVRAQSGGRRRVGTALCTLVLLLAAVAFSAAQAVQGSVAQRWDSAVAAGGSPDVVVTTSTGTVLERISKDRDLRPIGMSTQMLTDTSLQYRTNATERSVDARVHMVVAHHRSDQFGPISAGRWLRTPTPAVADEIVVDASLAKDLNVSVGATLTLQRAIAGTAASRDFRVVGLLVDVNNCLIPECAPGSVWINRSVGETLGPMTWTRHMQSYQLSPGAEPLTVARRIFTAEGNNVRVVATAEEIREVVVLVNGLLATLLSGFGVFVLIAAAILVSAVTTTRLATLRRDLGLFQIVGATPGEVVCVVVLQQVIAALLAAATGWAVVQAVADRLIIGPAAVLPKAGSPAWSSFATTAAALVAVALLSSALPAWRHARPDPLDAIRPASHHRPASDHHGRKTRWTTGNRLGGTGWLAAATARSQRTSLTVVVVSIAVTAAAGVAAAGIDTAMVSLSSGTDSLAAHDDLIVRSEDPTVNTNIDQVATTDPDVEATWRQSMRPVLVGERTARGRFVDGDIADLDLQVITGRLPRTPSEAVIGYGLARATGLNPGDTTIVVVEGRLVQATVVGQVLDGSNLGRIITMPMEAIPPDKRWAFARALRFRPEVDKSAAVQRYRELAQVPSTAGNTNALPQRTQPYRFALYALAAAVMAVGLGQLAAALTLMHRNRGATLATLSVVGVSDQTMVAAHACIALAVGVIGCAVALPLGVWACRSTVTRIATDLGIGPGFQVDIPWKPFGAMTTFFVVACGLTAAYLTLHHLRTHINAALTAS
jgi:ABC-type lipoprotein release transport system permease subunit